MCQREGLPLWKCQCVMCDVLPTLGIGLVCCPHSVLRSSCCSPHPHTSLALLNSTLWSYPHSIRHPEMSPTDVLHRQPTHTPAAGTTKCLTWDLSSAASCACFLAPASWRAACRQPWSTSAWLRSCTPAEPSTMWRLGARSSRWGFMDGVCVGARVACHDG